MQRSGRWTTWCQEDSSGLEGVRVSGRVKVRVGVRVRGRVEASDG
jgi:hypothetical protein